MENSNPSKPTTMSLVINGSVLIAAFILLCSLIHFSSQKLFIYFNIYMYLSKKQNYEKANYMVNSSFIKTFYTDRRLYGYINIERTLMIILLLLSVLAFFGILFKNNVNYGYLNYYYGDTEEYTFVNLFINNIIFLAIIYCSAQIYWVIYDEPNDGILDKNDTDLKTFIINHLSYEYLYEHYNAIKLNEAQEYSINTFVINQADTKIYVYDTHITSNFKDNTAIFKLCLTSYILNDTTRFVYIRKAIFDCIDNMSLKKDNRGDSLKILTQEKLTEKLANINIIANYNHNDNRALPPLEVMLDNLISNITTTDIEGKKRKTSLETVLENITNGNKDVKELLALHLNIVDQFRNTIEEYKKIYDKYSTYYMVSLLITNFLLTYSVLILLYILIKIFSINFTTFEKNIYNVYKFKTDLYNYVLFILVLYYFITCPMIIFGFN